MGATGNKFWELRSKHGRDKLFKSPELLWGAACEYFQWCDNNPWEKVETTVRGENTDVKTIPTERPYTVEGFCIYCDASRGWWKEFKRNNHDGFLPITTRIDEIIYKQKFEGAAVGAFNANIIARDLGLADNSNIKANNVNLNANLTEEQKQEAIDDIKKGLSELNDY